MKNWHDTLGHGVDVGGGVGLGFADAVRASALKELNRHVQLCRSMTGRCCILLYRSSTKFSVEGKLSADSEMDILRQRFGFTVVHACTVIEQPMGVSMEVQLDMVVRRGREPLLAERRLRPMQPIEGQVAVTR